MMDEMFYFFLEGSERSEGGTAKLEIYISRGEKKMLYLETIKEVVI